MGATRTRIARQIGRDTLGAMCAGTLAGLAASLALRSLLANLLFGIVGIDLPAYMIAVLALVAIGAGAIPCWRAATTDPARALQSR